VNDRGVEPKNVQHSPFNPCTEAQWMIDGWKDWPGAIVACRVP